MKLTLTSASPKVDYHPFQGPIDYALATWFLKAECSKGNVTDFFGNACLWPIHNLLSFKSAREWEEHLNNIPHGIPGEKWIFQKILVLTLLARTGTADHSIQYQDVIEVLRFLIGHCLFREHLVYAPVRQWDQDCEPSMRIRNEMHMGNW